MAPNCSGGERRSLMVNGYRMFHLVAFSFFVESEVTSLDMAGLSPAADLARPWHCR